MRQVSRLACTDFEDMMSKEAYLTDRAPHDLDHLMFELPRADGAA
jgi:hypothetical protein